MELVEMVAAFSNNVHLPLPFYAHAIHAICVRGGWYLHTQLHWQLPTGDAQHLVFLERRGFLGRTSILHLCGKVGCIAHVMLKATLLVIRIICSTGSVMFIKVSAIKGRLNAGDRKQGSDTFTQMWELFIRLFVHRGVLWFWKDIQYLLSSTFELSSQFGRQHT